MNQVQTIFAIGNIILFFASIRLMIRVIKNRNILSDYEMIGSALTFVGMLVLLYGYVLMENWISILFSIPTAILWFFASLYSFKRKNKKRIKYS